MSGDRLGTLLFLLFSASRCLDVVEACSCFPSHPQELFCNSEFVIKALVTSEARDIKSGKQKLFTMKSYSLTILEVFRGKQALTRLLMKKNSDNKIAAKLEFIEANITTPSSPNVCGVQMNFTGSYLIFGQIQNNELQVNMCNFLANWESVTNQVKSGIYGDYDCRCNIETRMGQNEVKKDKDEHQGNEISLEEHQPSYTCYWEMYPDEPVDECALNFLTCRKLVHPMSINNEREECVWVEGSEYETCRLSANLV